MRRYSRITISGEGPAWEEFLKLYGMTPSATKVLAHYKKKNILECFIFAIKDVSEDTRPSRTLLIEYPDNITKANLPDEIAFRNQTYVRPEGSGGMPLVAWLYRFPWKRRSLAEVRGFKVCTRFDRYQDKCPSYWLFWNQAKTTNPKQTQPIYKGLLEF